MVGPDWAEVTSETKDLVRVRKHLLLLHNTYSTKKLNRFNLSQHLYLNPNLDFQDQRDTTFSSLHFSLIRLTASKYSPDLRLPNYNKYSVDLLSVLIKP